MIEVVIAGVDSHTSESMEEITHEKEEDIILWFSILTPV
jgi:hypothetical protein